MSKRSFQRQFYFAKFHMTYFSIIYLSETKQAWLSATNWFFGTLGTRDQWRDREVWITCIRWNIVHLNKKKARLFVKRICAACGYPQPNSWLFGPAIRGGNFCSTNSVGGTCSIKSKSMLRYIILQKLMKLNQKETILYSKIEKLLIKGYPVYQFLFLFS